MSEPSSAAPRPRGGSEGVRTAGRNWTYASVLFALMDVLAGSLRSARDFNFFLAITWLLLVFLSSLVLGLVPALIAGARLAGGFSGAGGAPSTVVAFQTGAVLGALCLLPVLVIVLIVLASAADISTLLFRSLAAILVAALAGGRTGVQLARSQGVQ